MINIDTQDDNNDGKAEEINVNIGLTGIDPNEVKSVVILQSINYGISVSYSRFKLSAVFLISIVFWNRQEMLDAKMKLPMFSIFQTPNGFTKIHAQGTLNLNQKSSFSIGAIKREVNFEEFHFAENLLTMNFFGIFNKIQTQNVTLEY